MAVILCGCQPEEGVWWAPTGKTVAIRTNEGLRLATAEGELSGVILTGEIQSASWLADGSAIVVSRTYSVPDWKTAEALIPAPEAARTRELAGAVPDLLKAVVASGASIEDIEEKFFKPLGLEIVSDELQAIFLCAWSLHRDKILPAIAGTKTEKDLRGETNGIPISEISLLSVRDGKVSGEPRAIIRSVYATLDPRVSPHYPFVAYHTRGGVLKAATFDSKNDVIVAEKNVRSAAWSGDGRTLVYVAMPENGIGEVRRRMVANAEGRLLNRDQANDETLAVATFDPSGATPRLHTLPDGRILVASIPVTLPAAVASLSTKGQFFLLDTSKTNVTLTPITVKEGSLPGDLNGFAVSPDGKWVAVVEGGTDAVAILELATGKVEIISANHDRWNSRLIPAWRNNRELTFAALPNANATRPELMVWERGSQTRVLSMAWPDNVVKDWLKGP